jgi:hypothetical protein
MRQYLWKYLEILFCLIYISNRNTFQVKARELEIEKEEDRALWSLKEKNFWNLISFSMFSKISIFFTPSTKFHLAKKDSQQRQWKYYKLVHRILIPLESSNEVTFLMYGAYQNNTFVYFKNRWFKIVRQTEQNTVKEYSLNRYSSTWDLFTNHLYLWWRIRSKRFFYARKLANTCRGFYKFSAWNGVFK